MTMLNGVEFTRTGNPQADLKTYASARGISEAEAKTELEAAFGKPEEITSDSVDEDVSISLDETDEVTDTDEAEETDETDETDDTDSTDSEFTKDDAGRKELEKTIKYWNAKLKEATDAKDSYGVTYAQKQCKKYQEMAYNWDHHIDTDSTDETDSTDDADSASSSSSSSTSSSQATDRDNLQKEIDRWNARLKEATDAKDSYGVTKAQEQLKKYQTMAYEWDKSHYGF